MRKILHTLFLLNIISVTLYACSSNKGDNEAVKYVSIIEIEAQKTTQKLENEMPQSTEQQLIRHTSELPSQEQNSKEEVAEEATIKSTEQEIDASIELGFDGFFKKWTSAGKVDYNSLQIEKASLFELKTKIAAVKLNSLSTQQKKAFYINAYNFLVIAQVVDHFPINSPLDVDGFFQTTQFDVGGEKLTLSELEAKVSSDNRTHFALVCAAKGCPILQSSAFFWDKLETQLDAQTRNALNDPNFIRGSGAQTSLSKIFEWYAADFGGQEAFVSYLNKYRIEQLPIEYEISYYEYDWAINGK
jgi:hypothetical protein